MKNILFVVLALLLASQAFGLEITSAVFDKPYYSPGDRGELTLTISFQGEKLESLNLETTSSFFPSSGYFIGEAQTNAITIKLPFSIPENTPIGIYSIPIKIYGKEKVGLGYETKYFTSYITLKVLELPYFSLSLPSKAKNDEKLEFEICNLNQKSKAREVRVEVEGLLTPKLFYIENLEGCENLSLLLSVEKEGKNTLTFNIKYKDGLGEEREESKIASIFVEKPSSIFVITPLSEIYPQKESMFRFKIKNKGKEVTNIEISPIEGFDFVDSDKIVIDSLKEGEEKTLEVKVYTSNPPSLYPAKLDISWNEEGNKKEETFTVPVKIVGEKAVEVFLEANPLPLSVDKETTLSIVVANKAPYQISALDVELSGDFELLEPYNKKFIGSLESDDFSSEEFSVKFPKEGDYNATIKLTYKDQSGEVKEQFFSFPLKVVKPKEAEFDYTPLIMLAILIIGYALGTKNIFGFLTKRKK